MVSCSSTRLAFPSPPDVKPPCLTRRPNPLGAVFFDTLNTTYSVYRNEKIKDRI